jgi:hypothetical protein
LLRIASRGTQAIHENDLINAAMGDCKARAADSVPCL